MTFPPPARYTQGMEDQLEMTKKRLSELARRAERRGIVTFSEFLTGAEQAALLSLRPGPFEFDGGYAGAERRTAVFLPWEGAGYESAVACLQAAPASARFAGELGHRDCLGALMSLGIRREVLGDIVPQEGKLYIFCLRSIAPYRFSRKTAFTKRLIAVDVFNPTLEQNLSKSALSFWSTLAVKVVRAIETSPFRVLFALIISLSYADGNVLYYKI